MKEGTVIDEEIKKKKNELLMVVMKILQHASVCQGLVSVNEDTRL